MTTVIERRVHRRGTAAAWTAANPVLLAGEVGYETDTHRTKLGDGVTNWVTLPYDAPNATVLSSTFGPLPSGVPTVGQVPVVSTASPLALGWGAGGGGGGVGVVLASTYGFLPGATAAANETAFPVALAAAKAAKLPLYMAPGTYQKTTGLDLRATPTDAGGINLFGSGTMIVVTTDTAELLRVGGYSHYLHDFSIQHANFTPTATTGDGIVFYKAAYCTFKRLGIQSANNLLTIASGNVFDPGSGAGTGNWMFSCTFEDLGLHRYFSGGINLTSSGASTGSVFTNIYLQNGSPGSPVVASGIPLNLSGCDEMVFNQLNIEDHSGTGIAVLIQQSTAVFNSLHLERVPLTGWHPAYIRAYGISQITINQMTLAYCDVGDSGAGEYANLFTVGLGGVIDAKGIWVHECTKTGSAAWRLVQSDDTDARNAVTLSQPVVKDGSPAFTALTTSTYAMGIKRIGDASYAPATVLPVQFAKRYRAGGALAMTAWAATPIIFDGTDVPRNGTYVSVTNADGSANTSALRVSQPGIYMPSGQIVFAGGSSTVHNLNILVNGVGRSQSEIVAAGGLTMPIPITPIIISQAEVTAGGLMTISIYQEQSGVTVTGTQGHTTFFNLTYLGPA